MENINAKHPLSIPIYILERITAMKEKLRLVENKNTKKPKTVDAKTQKYISSVYLAEVAERQTKKVNELEAENKKLREENERLKNGKK